MRSVECIVEADNNGKEPSQDGEDLVGDDRVLRMVVALSEWVYCRRIIG